MLLLVILIADPIDILKVEIKMERDNLWWREILGKYDEEKFLEDWKSQITLLPADGFTPTNWFNILYKELPYKAKDTVVQSHSISSITSLIRNRMLKQGGKFKWVKWSSEYWLYSFLSPHPPVVVQVMRTVKKSVATPKVMYLCQSSGVTHIFRM